MWKMLERAFLERSPRLYMRTPQATAQYGQVLRVSVARASLNSRTSASAAVGEKPSSTRLEPAREAPVTFRNSRRVTSAMANPLLHVCRPAKSIPRCEGELQRRPCARCAAARMIARGGDAAGGFLLRLSYRRMEPKPRRVTRRGRGADGASIPRPRISPLG